MAVDQYPCAARGDVSADSYDSLHPATWAPYDRCGEFHRNDAAILRERATRQQHVVFRVQSALSPTWRPSWKPVALSLWRNDPGGMPRILSPRLWRRTLRSAAGASTASPGPLERDVGQLDIH